MRLSISKIQDFEKCKYSFYLGNIKKEKINVIPIQLLEGTEKHKIFEDVIVSAKEIFTKEKITKSEAIKKAILNDKNYSKYKQDCNNFVELSKNIEQQQGDPFPKHREIKLYNEELDLAGVIDRIDEEEENVLIIDYKTGRQHPIEDYYFQLATYVYMYEKQFNKKVTHWGIYFSKDGVLLKEKVLRFEIENAINRIKNTRLLINQTMRENNFPKQQSNLCKYCQWMQSKLCNGKNDR